MMNDPDTRAHGKALYIRNRSLNDIAYLHVSTVLMMIGRSLEAFSEINATNHLTAIVDTVRH